MKSRASVLWGIGIQTKSLRWAEAIVVAWALSCVGLSAAETEVTRKAYKVGFAQQDITPDIGMETFGNYFKQYARTVHDPCKVRASVFEDGGRRVALVGLDSLVVDRQTVLNARRRIEERCGLPAGHILIAASHSHSGGPLGWGLPGQYDHGDELVRKLAYEKSPMADRGYTRRVEDAIVSAVCIADQLKTDALLSFGSGKAEGIAFNRRLRMKGGPTFSHPGKGNPDILEYAGPVDPEVGVIGAWDVKGEVLLGVVVNYTCHATTPAPGFSANWIYWLERTIRGAMGAEVPVIFLQGDAGDVTQVDNLSPYEEPVGQKNARRVGATVAAEAVKVLVKAEPGYGGVVDARSDVWKIPRRKPSPEKVKAAREVAVQSEKEVGTTEWVFAKETVLLDALIQREPEVEVEVQAIQIGPAVFVSNPAEYFVSHGLEMKRRSPFKWTWAVELANGCVGYVPNAEAFEAGGGGYETRLTSYSNLDITAGRQFLERGLKLLENMKPGVAPEPPKAPAWKAPWNYGNNPPELK